MIIPKTFQIAAQTYTVYKAKEIQHEMDGDTCDCYGICVPMENKIVISSTAMKSRQETVWLHELTHAILNEMGHELYHDETFVQTFSNLLHQSFVTSKSEAK